MTNHDQYLVGLVEESLDSGDNEELYDTLVELLADMKGYSDMFKDEDQMEAAVSIIHGRVLTTDDKESLMDEVGFGYAQLWIEDNR